jgi:two-component sensor histidine kinase/CheY-like chemotaxis protein
MITQEAPEKNDPCSDPGKSHILLVDDHPENLVALEGMLSGMNQNLVKANSGKEALKWLLTHEFAVILLDVKMPEIDGFETAALIRSRDASRHTPIIFVTAHDIEEAQVSRGYSLGAVDYISKPIIPEILKSKVNVFVDLHQKTAQIRRQKEMLIRNNEDLERRVIQRTRELASANRELEGEVAERRGAEEKLLASLQEKEVLLKEIHHRVKNNLQIVYSLLNLESKQLRDECALKGLQDCRERIKTMALIHEKLYRSRDLARIDFGDYIKDLVKALFDAYGTPSCVRLQVKTTEGVSLRMEQAVPCGLVLYELVSNSLKHAFPGNRRGEILVALAQESDGKTALRVKDDGVGLPEGLNIRTCPSLGLQLVGRLVDQMQGTVEFFNQGGSEALVRFQVKDPADREVL